MSWLIILYMSLLTLFFIGTWLLPKFHANSSASPIGISIIVCARNEAKTIVPCLESILKQNYPRQAFEVIVVDDASTDETAALAKEFLAKTTLNYTLLSNQTAFGKKRSLAKAIASGKQPLLVTRDADTYCPSENWLTTLAVCHAQEHLDVIIAPIAIEHSKGFLSVLQNLENRVLRFISAGSAYFNIPFLNSGANFAFTRAAYDQVGGYTSHLHIESGDDVFFLQELQKQKNLKIGFVNSADALVYTYPATSFKSLLQQRARWAGKVLKRPSVISLVSGLIIIGTNALFLYALIALFFHPQTEVIQIVIFKAGMDFFLLFLAGFGFEKRPTFLQVFGMILLYPFYLLASSVASIFTKPRWK